VLNPLCKQNVECAGWGANAVTGAPAEFNIVKLSFTDQTKSFEGMREPVEAQVTPVLGPQFAVDTQTFATIADFTEFVQAKFAAHTPPQGSNGIYGTSFKDIMDSYFLRCGNHSAPYPQRWTISCDSLSISSASRSIVQLTLPFDPVTNKYRFTLDKFAERAIQSLPPPSVYANISSWWGIYGPLYRTFFGKYGTDIIVSASLGGMVEQYSSFDSGLDSSLSKDQLVKDAKIDFTTSTGIGGQTGPLDKNYTRDLSPPTCVGGDPSKCTKDGISGGSWGDSTKSAPALLQYKIVPISELLGEYDLSIKSSLEAAAEQYVGEGQRQWQDYYSAYLSCQPPFDYTKDPLHCPFHPTPPPTPGCHTCPAGYKACVQQNTGNYCCCGKCPDCFGDCHGGCSDSCCGACCVACPEPSNAAILDLTCPADRGSYLPFVAATSSHTHVV
jgi:hypothetical protein